MDELVDKVWYNRHMNMMYRIEHAEIKVGANGAENETDAFEIHPSILQQAQAVAERIREKYDDTGPWDDFQWGMINGKLSALRWVLGDEWDMLDT